MHPFLTPELLLSVRKPGRYIGGEIGAVKKDLSQMAVKVCLAFPDIYEVGMSHLGLRILYDVINREPDCAAERVFAPWSDMEEKLKASGVPLFSLESGAPLKDFDILGFSLQYELCYTNVLLMLALAGIPLSSSERDGTHPLVIAGGTCCLNPEPMADFIDAFVVGEGEEVMLELISAVKEHGGRKNRRALLEALSRICGVYVPSLYDVDAETGRRSSRIGALPQKISRRYVKNLSRALNLQNWIVPYIEIVHDRICLEIMRGCPHACRFCQARSSFYPLRILGEQEIVSAARRLMSQTGYEELSLLSLSSSDHPHLARIVASLQDEFRQKGASISLPSLRAKTLVGELSHVLATMRKTSLTFAPEAGSERLRRLINKNLDLEELFRAAGEAYRAGYRLLKLYFMIGFPTETQEDLGEIVALCGRLSRLKKEFDNHPASVHVSVSNFIPKPHTPFQWEGMASVEALKEKQRILKDLFRRAGKAVQPSFHRPETSFLEAVLALGDRRLAPVIRAAFERGAKFDAWNEFFNFSLWESAFATCGIEASSYVKPKDCGARLVWDFIEMPFSRAVLEKEAHLARGFDVSASKKR